MNIKHGNVVRRATSICLQTSQQPQVSEEVERLVGQYTSTGKIPSSLLEASIFRKPFYIGQLLPALLAPRPVRLTYGQNA